MILWFYDLRHPALSATLGTVFLAGSETVSHQRTTEASLYQTTLVTSCFASPNISGKSHQGQAQQRCFPARNTKHLARPLRICSLSLPFCSAFLFQAYKTASPPFIPPKNTPHNRGSSSLFSSCPPSECAKGRIVPGFIGISQCLSLSPRWARFQQGRGKIEVFL